MVVTIVYLMLQGRHLGDGSNYSVPDAEMKTVGDGSNYSVPDAARKTLM